jgi:hypothetical protein
MKTRNNSIFGKYKSNPVNTKPTFYSTYKELILVLATILMTTISNQLFYTCNRKIDVLAEIRKENIINQYPIINRIMVLTHKYKIVTVVYFTTQMYNNVFYNPETKAILYSQPSSEIDTLGSDSLSVPDFIYNKNVRESYLETINYIFDNKYKVDFDVVVEIEKLEEFMHNHPLPGCSIEEILKSDWSKKTVQDEYFSISDSLFDVTYRKIQLWGFDESYDLVRTRDVL